jgi:hypothetical protein
MVEEVNDEDDVEEAEVEGMVCISRCDPPSCCCRPEPGMHPWLVPGLVLVLVLVLMLTLVVFKLVLTPMLGIMESLEVLEVLEIVTEGATGNSLPSPELDPSITLFTFAYSFDSKIHFHVLSLSLSLSLSLLLLSIYITFTNYIVLFFYFGILVVINILPSVGVSLVSSYKYQCISHSE